MDVVLYGSQYLQDREIWNYIREQHDKKREAIKKLETLRMNTAKQALKRIEYTTKKKETEK